MNTYWGRDVKVLKLVINCYIYICGYMSLCLASRSTTKTAIDAFKIFLRLQLFIYKCSNINLKGAQLYSWSA